jgi:hypothetical protein
MAGGPAKTLFNRTLSGAVVTLAKAELRVVRARRRRGARLLTKQRAARPKQRKTR